MADADLLGLYWTVSGPVELHVGREWSLFDSRDRCEHAARVGMAGIGLWHADLEHQLETRDLADVKPFDVNVHDLDAALAVVEGADAPNGGLAIDTWHMAKLGIEPDDLQRIPAKHLAWVELSDGCFENMDDLVDEAVNHRRLPGEGEFPIGDSVAACRRVGFDGPGVEVLGGAAEPADRADLRAGVRDVERRARRPNGKECGCLRTASTVNG